MNRNELTGFAEACYDQNTIADLEAALAGAADPVDMAEWSLSEQEWRDAIATAIRFKRADAA